MTEIELRAFATTETEKRFRGKPFDWTKQATCIHLMRFHARQMQHDLQLVPRFRSQLGAKKALKAMGHDNIISLMDGLFPRIAPAFMRIGDIMAVDGDAGFDSLLIRGSASKFLGWHEDAEGCTIMGADLSIANGAWRL